QELLCPGRPDGRRRNHHDPGPGERWPASAPARLPRGARAAVRVLHAGDDPGGVGPAPGQSAPQRRGDPRGSRGQPVPLHRLREHRERRAARRAGGSERMTATEIPETKTAELGKARLRKEDERLLTGQTNWTDNITLP